MLQSYLTVERLLDPIQLPSVGDCVLVVIPDFTLVCRLFMLRDRVRAVRGLRAIAAGYIVVGSDLSCI